MQSRPIFLLVFFLFLNHLLPFTVHKDLQMQHYSRVTKNVGLRISNGFKQNSTVDCFLSATESDVFLTSSNSSDVTYDGWYVACRARTSLCVAAHPVIRHIHRLLAGRQVFADTGSDALSRNVRIPKFRSTNNQQFHEQIHGQVRIRNVSVAYYTVGSI